MTLSDRLRFRDVRSISTFRLTALLGLLFALGMAGMIGLIYLQTAEELDARSDAILRLEAKRLHAVSVADLPARITADIAQNTSRLNYYALESADGRLIVGNIAIPSGLLFDRPVDVPEGPGIPQPVRMLASRTAAGETLIIARDMAPVVDLRRRMLTILITSGLVIALAVLVCGFLLSLAPLRRVRDLQRVSRRIAAGDLNARMPVLGRHDELDQFAGTVNVMVEDVGRVILQVKEVTDVIAHDLRAPLAHVRRLLGRIAEMPGLPAAAGEIAEAGSADLETVLDRFAALLRISELEDGRRRAGFGEVKLLPMLTTVYELYEPVAEEAGIGFVLDCPDGLSVNGDAKLLFEAVSNLVDNGLKFTAAGGHVSLTARADDGVVIEIRDNGRGIAENEREAVLRRFFRGANSVDVPGSGVGLSIVMAIVRLHDFSFELGDAAPGLAARIRCRE
ncbi:sensor histidine kinase [Sphingomonas sp. MMS24-J13]|uniref:sensor histidine kinase n=1 Tax=Sphingomonas sp. MMS24-J13 TaxID=3238686 RepID=UPI00384EE0CB